ncbi:YjbE family putative metal transport protein [Azospira restricta]|uniref:YjbE family putative metal transport protein n=1 Tax=Azospira restricta TaxID=404405 RepID=A0A974PXJ3_9RHOO|nr:YjbE family putative metal transport protein [Azospira restricta]QRJ63287.1 YjbE family putative metal transport protein [Azospira restricta]
MIEFGTPAFWVALIQIIGADIVLSGDNAVVIALATRSLPPQQQRLAIFWGTFAAVAMRVTLTVVAVALLKLPVLKLVGALLLLWIAVQLLLPEEESEGGSAVGGSLAAAIRTILMADLVMSVDNVIAIAAAAKGNFVLLMIGLAVSIPLVIFTSTFLLKLMERYPVIITVGAALLGWVAGEMAVTDPLVADAVKANASWLHTAAPAAGALLVVAVGKWLAARAVTTEEARPLAEIGAAADTAPAPPKESAMHKILLPVDGSPASLRAVDAAIAMRDWFRTPIEVHLLNVQHVLHQDVGQFVAAEDVHGYQQEQGERELAEAKDRLDAAGVSYRPHVVTGDLPAEVIAHFAREHGIAQILMSTHGRSALADALLGSVAHGVLQRAAVPLTLIR